MFLYKKVKHGSKIVQKSLYSYKESLVKLYNRQGFHELWRKRRVVEANIYDGAVWKNCLCVNGKPFLSAPYNLISPLN